MPNGNVKGVFQNQADKYKKEIICKEELLPLHNLFAFIKANRYKSDGRYNSLLIALN